MQNRAAVFSSAGRIETLRNRHNPAAQQQFRRAQRPMSSVGTVSGEPLLDGVSLIAIWTPQKKFCHPICNGVVIIQAADDDSGELNPRDCFLALAV